MVFGEADRFFKKKSLFEKTILKDEMYFEEMNRQ